MEARVSSASQARRDEPKKWEVTGLKMAEGEEDEEEEGEEEEAVLRYNIAVGRGRSVGLRRRIDR